MCTKHRYGDTTQLALFQATPGRRRQQALRERSVYVRRMIVDGQRFSQLQ
jgi:hypothetical protein